MITKLDDPSMYGYIKDTGHALRNAYEERALFCDPFVDTSIPNEGKSTVSLALAQALAASGKSVLLVDCDLRRRALANMTGSHAQYGIYSVLAGQASLDEATVETDTRGLYFLDCEPHIPNPVDILASRRFKALVEQMRQEFGYVVILEAMGDTAEELVEDAKAMVKAVPGNTFVKIPACPEGFKAIRELKNAGIATSCTAVYTFNQAMLAAMAGASYVAVYVSRLDKNGGDGIEVVRRIKQAFVAHNIDCVVSAASLKTPLSLQEAIEAGADNVTVDLEMLEALAVHPMTEGTLKTFKSDWEGLFGEGVRIVDMVA